MDANSIKLYPMTQDVSGKRTHEQYVDQMASMIVRMVIDYRLDYSDLKALVIYAEQNHERLNK